MKSREIIRRRRNVAAALRVMFVRDDGSITPGVTVTGLGDAAVERKAAIRAVHGRLTGGAADRSTAQEVRRRRLRALAPLARELHEALSYEPEGERVKKLTRTGLIDRLREWLWIETDPDEPAEGVSVEAIAEDVTLWAEPPGRRAFRDLFRGMSIEEILDADRGPAPASPARQCR
jgi:hypothetical protein